MQTKALTLGVIAIGASALGGVLLITASGGDDSTDQAQQDQQQRLAMSGYEGSELASLPSEPAPAAERSINTQGRGGAPTSNRGGFGAMMDRMPEFDTDGDGILSDEERRDMMRAMRDEMMAKFDLDGDGEISREERMAARQSRFEQSDRGQELMRQFDADGNGVLDDEEQAAMEAFQEEEREQRRQEQIAQYDTDGDGVVSREERQVQRDEQRSRWQDTMQQATNEFDHDGDGQLSIEESQEAFAVMQQRREIDRFVSDYDRDGNGSMGAADYDAFLSDYSAGDLRADVNRDGEVNSSDLAAYTDMVTRSRNRP